MPPQNDDEFEPDEEKIYLKRRPKKVEKKI
jgi:hypothetical protein